MARAFQPPVLALPESLLLVLPRRARQAKPVLAWASQQVEPVSAEVMSAWQLAPLVSQLVWVQQQPVGPRATIEAPMPVRASVQESLVSRNCPWL